MAAGAREPVCLSLGLCAKKRNWVTATREVNLLLSGLNVHLTLECLKLRWRVHICMFCHFPLKCLCALTCVAQMTGFPAELQRPIIIFWAMKTFSAGISMPRSPLATITPSLSARISSKLMHRLEERGGEGLSGDFYKMQKMTRTRDKITNKIIYPYINVEI